MGRRRHAAEEVINSVRQADVELGKGNSVAGVFKLPGVTEPTYFRWRKEYGGLKFDQAIGLTSLSRRTPGSSACWLILSAAVPRTRECRFPDVQT